MVSNKLNPESALLECERLLQQALAQFQTTYATAPIKRWWIAHSGGLDSQLLLHLAARYLPAQQLGVIHINHALQADADQWQLFSQQQAQGLGVEFYTQTLQLSRRSEDAARQGRYTCFEAKLDEHECLLLGHHADDQAETMLFRQLRGTGLQGITGMPLARKLGQGYLFRPLLSVPKETLQQALSYLDVEFIDDPSNASDQYDRNYLRNQVLPLLKQRWPHAIARFLDNAQRLQQAQMLLDEYLQDDLAQVLTRPDQLNLRAYAKLSSLRQSAVLRYWLQTSVNQTLNQRQLDEIVSSVIGASNDAMPEYALLSCRIKRYQASLYLVASSSSAEAIERCCISSDGEYDLGDGCLTISGLAAGVTLKLQRRQGGERCVPLGGSQYRQVKKLLQEQGLLPWYRERWPLLYRDDNLVIVPGVCVCAEEFTEISGFSVIWQPFSLFDKG